MGDVWGGDVLKAISRKSSSLVLLSIIAPISILVGFRLSGVLQGQPLTFDTITMDTVEWNFTRPEDPDYGSKHIPIAEWITNSYNDFVSAVKFSIFASSYYEEDLTFGDYFEFKMVFSANLSKGFIYKLQIKFSPVDDNAYLNIIEEFDDEFWVETHNLSIPTVGDSFDTNEPYIDAMAPNRPNNCYLKMFVFWEFFDENNINHISTVLAEITLYNGSKYLKIQIPITLRVAVL